MKLRIANTNDIETLVFHRRQMFLDIDFERYGVNGRQGLEKTDSMYREYLTNGIPSGQTIGVVIEDECKIVASGCVSFVDWPSEPLFMSNKVCHIHSVYTIPDERRKGYARVIMTEIERHCKNAGQRVLILWASRQGKPMYFSMGYEETPSCMMKIII
jgi:GNAT superfamily N-acetyltransferase